MPKSALEHAIASALQRWEAPFPGFTSGRDPRSSDNALLVLTYGGLEHAARHDWLNAGRRLIDKTYIDILWHVQQLTDMRACNAERIAAALDDVIRTQIAPEWASLGTLPTKDKSQLATNWVEHLAANAFGSLQSEPAASRLLFYLCPMLPVFNFSRGHLIALEHLGFPTSEPRYRAFATTAEHAYRKLSTALNTATDPTPYFGDTKQHQLVRNLLDPSEWWPRRVFDQLLRDSLPANQIALFGCNDAGQLIEPTIFSAMDGQ